MIHTDLCIIGAGPVGLFAVFEAGLLKMRCHLIDALPQVGGQLSEIYPQKPIYDIPGYPEVNAQDLVDNLMEQAKPFSPTFTLGERVDHLDKQEDGSFIVTTSDKTHVHAKVIVIAGGLGCFEPRKPVVENLELFEGKGVTYMVKNPETFRDKNVILAGGGDSALDWTIFLSKVAKRVTLVHRNETFRGAPDSAAKVFDLANNGKIDLILSANLKELGGNGKLDSVTFVDKSKIEIKLEADYLIPLFGLSPKLGPIADWGLSIDKNAIEVDTRDYSTGVDRIYAIGDINTYPGKLKLILCGFHEAAIMMHSAFKYVYPDQKLSFKYTTVNGVNSF
ncbi:NAD(P)/FAD-dependent oxidoreductase [Algoriphagus sp. D3-2-R+10]|uniref:NAD(P)/FAD-dependent oxidoreductase n=1 Tax=Algoriphagus aurantiacus TaxID=3103948 RepID=UPI002B3DD126|nr:NAD(P)/FAD-dependent oxidoreductase [Algoriphagus sp. D3-2-R+10]MEB2776950.1 NAD(P)/FAD-dependent oxidoreductase [Algoriphagus sp. D3-2-R+10]